MYARNDGKQWIPTMLFTGGIFPLACFSIAAVLNTIAIAYHSLAAVPFGTIVVMLLIWLMLSFPLCLLGTVRAQPRAASHQSLCAGCELHTRLWSAWPALQRGVRPP